MTFKTCTTCRRCWTRREEFLSDPAISLVGYQANFRHLDAGVFLFNHDLDSCGTTLAMEAGLFTDMHEGPIFKERLTNTAECSGYCMRENSLEPCPNPCECAYVRDVLQTVKNWPKQNGGRA